MIHHRRAAVGKSLFHGQNSVLYGEKHNLLPNLCTTGLLLPIVHSDHEVRHPLTLSHKLWTPLMFQAQVISRLYDLNTSSQAVNNPASDKRSMFSRFEDLQGYSL